MVDRHHPGKAPTALLQALSEGQCRTLDTLAVEMNLTHRQVSEAATRLLRRDYLMRMAAGCYQLTDAGIAAAQAGEVITSGPRGPISKVRDTPDTLRERAWRSMRMRIRFTVLDLAGDAAQPSDMRPVDSLHRYLRCLKHAGYIVELPHRQKGSAPSSNGHKRYMLSKNTGPRAPVIRSQKTMRWVQSVSATVRSNVSAGV